MENNNLKIKICKKCNLSEQETPMMVGRRVCNKCRNTVSNAKLIEKGYFNEYCRNHKDIIKVQRHAYYEKNRESILLQKKEYKQRKKLLLQQNEN